MAIRDLLRPRSGSSPRVRNGNSKARVRIRTVLVVFLSLDAVLLFLVFRPLGRSVAEREAELLQSRTRFEGTLTTVKQMRDLRTKMQSAIQNDRQFAHSRFLLRQTAFSAMLSDLERLARQNHLTTSNISYRLKDKTKQPGFVNVEVGMAVDGDYTDLMHFINRLEQSQLFWIIDNLTVSPGATHGLRLNVQMETYAVSS